MRAAAAVLAAAVLTGCTSGDDGGGDGEHSRAGLDPVVMAMDPTSVDPKRIDYPLDTFSLGNEDVRLINQAIGAVEQKCFQRFGLDLPIPEPPNGRAFPVWDWYGLWDEQATRSYGYSSPPMITGGEPFADAVPPEWAPVLGGEQKTFNGLEIPEGGCQGEALRALGGRPNVGADVEVLQREAVNRARQHDAVKPLIKDWAKCMKQGGWDFSDPKDPFSDRPDPKSVGGRLEMSPAELDMALHDINCKKSTGLLRAWVAADVANQQLLVEENAEALREMTDLRAATLNKANDIVAGR